MYKFSAYGLNVLSDFDFVVLDQFDFVDQHDVKISAARKEHHLIKKIKTKNTQDIVVYEENLVIKIKENLGIFYIYDGNKIEYQLIDENIKVQDLAREILNLCFAYILFQRSFLVIHASAVLLNERSFLFIGDSGLGKSSIAYDLVKRHKAKIISEDFCAIKKEGEDFFINSSYPLIKLSSKIRKFDENIDLKLSYDDLGRNLFKLNKNEFYEGRSQISKLFFLSWSKNINIIEPLDKIQALKKIFSSCVRYLPARHAKNEEKNVLEQSSMLINNIECYDFRRQKNGLDMQNKVLLDTLFF